MSGFDMKDYVPVDERIREFRKQYPAGSLQSTVLRWPDEHFPFIAVQAMAYRIPNDPRPGVGLAYENFPGKTPYTRDSELMNAETSAWGRAIVAALAGETKRGPVASRDEVFRAQANRMNESPVATGTSPVGAGADLSTTDEPEAEGGTGGDWKPPSANGSTSAEGAVLPNEAAPSAWSRYLAALIALADRDKIELADARKKYVMELCKVNRWAYPPREQTDAERLNEIAAELEELANQAVLA
jgi:hypothetical protein